MADNLADLTDLIAAHTLRVVELNEAARYPECNGCDWVGGLVKDHAAHLDDLRAALEGEQQ